MRPGRERAAAEGSAPVRAVSGGAELGDFDYQLPPDRIAQEPPPRRGEARLLVLRRGGPIEHRSFLDLNEYVSPGDLLVVNDTRVRQARLFGRKGTGGSVEVLLLDRRGSSEAGESWTALVRSSRPVRAGAGLRLEGGIRARVEGDTGPDGEARLTLRAPGDEPIDEMLPRHGAVPLPPYVRREPEDSRAPRDRMRYQTVFARDLGSAAAPTAGLHFTNSHLRALRAGGVGLTAVTLHVGRGTFQPIRARRLEQHRMHPEWCRLTAEAARAIATARNRGGRVIAVGTTVVRTLEARWGPGGPTPGEGAVDLFIRPGHRFRGIDALLTNFHLPRSTLLVLVSAFAGRERVLGAYREAIEHGYRFYSYGDAMLVL